MDRTFSAKKRMTLVYYLNTISTIPDLPGVYQYIDINQNIIYVGKAINLRKRVSSYFRPSQHDFKTNLLRQKIKKIKIIPVHKEFEALLLEASLIKKFQPKYNIVAKDDKRYIYITVTKEVFPRLLLTRGEGDYGPFPSAKIARDILRLIRSIVPYCTQSAKVNRPCLYSHLGLCYPCPAHVRAQTPGKHHKLKSFYRRNIRHIKLLLSGNLKKIKTILNREMSQFSKDEKFEEAAKKRDSLSNLDYLINYYRSPDAYQSNPDLLAQTTKIEQKELSNILSKYYTQLKLLKNIECYDISNIQGKKAVGSMVTFIDGIPDKRYYRRFRIRLTDEPNDIAMLREIFSRRLKHRNWPFPDLIVVDGGKPQLAAMLKLNEEFKYSIPIIGLAKRFEEIVISNGKTYDSIRLPGNSSALHLLLRLRDEAHRFAHLYHELLVTKELLQ